MKIKFKTLAAPVLALAFACSPALALASTTSPQVHNHSISVHERGTHVRSYTVSRHH